MPTCLTDPVVLRARTSSKELRMLWAIVAILLILWLLGLTVLNVGSLIHVLVVIALVVIIYQLVTGRRRV